jgi:thiamine biosynthesis lipoprotein
MPPIRAAASDELGCASWSALGTTVVLRATDTGALTRARASVVGELDAIDRACSSFRADSELARVNDAGGRAVRVSDLFAEALALALRAAELTDGDVDPTVGRALELAGAYGDTPAHTSRITLRARAGWRTVALDRQHRTVRVPRGIRLDLGATAKAWAADRAARAAAASAGCGVLVGVGGDISTCGEAPARGWLVHVTDDHRSDADTPGQTIALFCGGLATSSTTVRRWRDRGRAMHHIVDPRTGAPARAPWRTVSVAAASCADANIATTAALVRGTPASAWLQELGLPTRLVDHDGHASHIGAWPAESRESRR